MEILTSGVSLFSRMREAEEQLQTQLINGDHQAVAESEGSRLLLKKEATALEEKRRAFLLPGMSLHRFITTRVNRSRQGEFLAKLQEIEAELQKLIALHTVNCSLLEERIRFSRELQEICYPEKSVYDQKGQLKSRPDKASKNLDRNC